MCKLVLLLALEGSHGGISALRAILECNVSVIGNAMMVCIGGLVSGWLEGVRGRLCRPACRVHLDATHILGSSLA